MHGDDVRTEQSRGCSCWLVQLALEPLWRLYEVCIPGTDADVKAVMGKAVKSLNLTQVTST